MMTMTGEILELPAPIFRKFMLNGLNGYKDVSLTCHSPVKIACADNGAGKTSLLNALYAVFEGRPALLHAIDFESLEVVGGNGEVSVHRKTELFGELSPNDLEAVAQERLFTEQEVDQDDAIELLTKYILGETEEAEQTRAYKIIYRDSPYNRDEIFERLSSLCEPALQSGEFSDLYERAKIALDGCSVLYLPTYRRIEAEIPEFSSRQPSTSLFRSKNRVQKDVWNSTRLIFFGMKDVEAQLNSILSLIRKETLDASTRSYGQTLEQLIGADSDSTLQETFDIPSIAVVLARVGKNTPELRARLTTLIESDEIYNENRGELRRFLSQLLKVYAQRRDDEAAIERFTNVVNSYLCPEGDDPSATIKSEKRLTFDKVKLEVKVKSRIRTREIKFGNLSSGEKQLVSIFARLMLDPRRKYLVLVDEPELSLSLEWQQRLLPDICSAPNFTQLVAITHSPFIFDNEFSMAAGTIETSYRAIEEEK